MSNFDSRGPVKVGERQAVGMWGTFDMAGNIKEWCVNPVADTSLRYILGGGWNEPVYRYFESDARDQWRREASFGLRLIKNLGPTDSETTAPLANIYGDPSSIVPVSDELFAVYRRFYDYDRLPVEARLEATDESQHWRKEKVSFSAAYGAERIPAYLFLPKNATPPYQTIVYFPTSYSRSIRTSETLDLNSFEFIVRSGRAVVYPVYEGTFERFKSESPGMAASRDRMVMWGKDFLRAVDYLATRQDIDVQRLAYYGFSMGGYFGPIAVALEPRIKVAVFAAGGLRFNYPPEIQPANFMPRVRLPTLLINGTDDFQVPEASRKRFLELLGTSPEHKKLVQLEGGHIPNDMHGFFREILGWFEKHLGPVR
jgi:dienelactone hydrolase